MSEIQQGQEHEAEAEGVEVAPEANVIRELEDVMGDPAPEEMTVQPAAGEPAAATEPEPVAAAPTAVEPAAVEMPTQRDDGKWTMGKFVADDLAGLVVQMNKARDHAERYAGQKSPTDPFQPLEPEDDEVIELDESDFEASIGRGVANALVEALGLQSQQVQQQPQVDPVQLMQLRDQTYEAGNAVVNDPEATPLAFRQVLQNLVLYAPDDKDSRDAVLQAWAERPGQQLAAFRESTEIDQAFQQIAAQQRDYAIQQQQQAELVQQQQADEQETDLVEQNAAAFEIGQQAFVQTHPDWPQHNAGINAFLQANPALMASAKGNPQAIKSLFDTAYLVAAGGLVTAPVAGNGSVASEQGSNMGNVTAPVNAPAQAAAVQALQEQQLNWAALETGAGPDGAIDVTVTNPGATTIHDAPLGDVIGIPLVTQ